MQSPEIKCGQCDKLLPKHLRVVNCDICKHFFHVKCSGISHKEYKSIKTSNTHWNCKICETNVLNYMRKRYGFLYKYSLTI